jgi:uncharacterized membrane protein
MKKQIFIILALILGFTDESFAAAGKANDEFLFFVVVIGFLMFIYGLLSISDYSKKNGRKIFNKAITSLKWMNSLIKGHWDKIKSNHFDLSYF